MTWHPLPSPGSRRLRFPCFVGTVRCSDVLRSFPPRFVAFAWRYPWSHSVFVPVAVECAGASLELVSRYPTGHNRGDRRTSQVPGKPFVPMPCSSTPAGPARQALRRSRHGPRYVQNEGSRNLAFEAQSHGLGTRCLRFVRCSCPHPTQNSLPAAGQALPDGTDYPQGSAKRFLNRVLPFILLSQASWRKDIPDSGQTEGGPGVCLGEI